MRAHEGDHRAGRDGGGRGPAARQAARPALAGLQRAAGNQRVTRAVEESRLRERRDSLDDVLGGNSNPLDRRIRTRAEAAYGMPFGHVETHNDRVAQRVAADFGARALTVDHHIVLGAPRISDEDMFHELDHVRQQAAGPVPGTDDGSGTRTSSPTDAYERQSTRNGRRVAGGEAPDVSLPG